LTPATKPANKTDYSFTKITLIILNCKVYYIKCMRHLYYMWRVICRTVL